MKKMTFKDHSSLEMLSLLKGAPLLLQEVRPTRTEFSFAIFILPVLAASLFEWGIYMVNIISIHKITDFNIELLIQDEKYYINTAW